MKRKLLAKNVKKAYGTLLLILLSTPLFAGNNITELFFSEYIEGSSFNKAVEIYNGTGGPVDLAAGNYTLEIYFNGNATPSQTFNLTGTIADNDVFVAAHTNANTGILSQADFTNGGLGFNGDDAIALRKNGVLVDLIGVIGTDPGSEWGTGNASTQNNTIVRKPDSCDGNTAAAGPFDPAINWDGFANNTIDNLGSHTTNCGSGAGAVFVTCNSPATTIQGQAVTHPVSATDADGTVVTIAITTIDPMPTAGSITLGNLVPAMAVGGTATADITANDMVPIGNYAVTIEATNNDASPESNTCTLNILVSGELTIAEIQGTPTTQGPGGASPAEGLSVQTTGIVTALKSNGFFMQMMPGDGDDQSSDGIFVFTNAAPAVSLGDDVQVTGEVVEFFGYTEFTNGPAVQVLSSGNTLPSAIELAGQFPNPNQPASQLERLEGMLVSITNGTATTPTRVNFGINNFYAVVNGQKRNIREAGIELPGLPNLPVFDTNPEAIRIDTAQVNNTVPGGVSVDVTAGQTVTATGPLEFAFSEFRLLADQNLSITGPAMATAIRDKQAGEFTVASFNMEFLDVANTTKIQKASLAIRNVLKAPDIVALQEVVNQAALDALRNQIASDDPSINYTAMVPADSDGFNQEVAYLVKDTVSNTSFSELGIGLTYPNSSAGCSQETLHNRPPYVLDCTVTPPGGQAYNITVINIHLRSLSRVDDQTEGPRVRMKRFLAARSLAGFVQDMQQMDPNRRILVAGDFNAYPFSDGYVDVSGIISGNPGFDLIESNTYSEIVNPPLRLLSDLAKETERYSFVFGKNAQQLDQIMATDNFGCDITGLEFGRLNADFPENVFENDVSRPERASDHDPPVVFIQTAASPLPVITVKDIASLEGSSANTFISLGVDLCSTTTQPVTVDWALVPGTAEAGSDYVDASGTLTIPANDSGGQVDVEILADFVKEFSEEFYLVLSNPTNAIIGDMQGKATLINDDQPDPLRLKIDQSTLRGDGHQVLKAWTTGGSGQGTFGVQWRDVTPMPTFNFDANANPVVIEDMLPDPAAFRVEVVDFLGNQIEGTTIIGNSVSLLAPSWNKVAPNFEWDNNNVFNIIDWTAIINFSQVVDTSYPCDP